MRSDKTLWMRSGCTALFVSSAKPGSGHLGLLARQNYSALTLEPVQSCFSKLLLRQHTRSVPPLLLSHPFAHGMGARSQHLLERPVAEEFSISHLFDRVSVVRILDAAAMLLRRGIGQVSPEQAERWAREDPRFIRPPQNLLTTREVVAAEWAIIEMARAGQDKHDELGRGGSWVMRNVAVAVDKGQAAAVEHLLQSKDFATSVRGPAGAGKTSMAREAVQALEALLGRRVVMFSPSRAGVKELQKEGFQRAETFAKLRKSSALQEETGSQILWIDEASFMSVQEMKWLFEFAAAKDCRLILSGDTR